MEFNPKEVTDGKRWFLLGGSMAIALSITLLKIDDGLSFSTGERDKGNVILDIRNAQSHLKGHGSETRDMGLENVFANEVRTGRSAPVVALLKAKEVNLEKDEKKVTDGKNSKKK
jgi:hypothetical protein